MGLPRRAQFIIFATVALGGFSTWALCDHFAKHGIGSIWLLCVFSAFVLASWLWPIVMYQGTSSRADHLDEGLFVLLALTMQPIGAVLAFGIATVIAQAIRRRSFIKSIFNLAQILVSVSAGLAVMHLVDPPTTHLRIAELATGVLGAFVYFLVNSIAVAAILAAIGDERVRGILFDGLEIRTLLLGASLSIGIVSALAVVAYPFAALLSGLPFWAFRQTLAGHYRARHDRTRLRGLFDATLDVNRHMREDDVTVALKGAASDLLRSPDVEVVDAPPTDDNMSAAMEVRDERRWIAVSGRSRGEPFDDADRALLDALAAVGSGALENASLYEELRHQQESLRAMTASLGEGVCAFDADGHVTFINPSAEDLIGWSEEEITASGGLPDEVLALLEPAIEAMRTGATVRSQRGTTFRRRSGETFPVEFTCTLIRSEQGDGRVDGAVIAFRDISDHLAFEEQLAFHAFHDALTGLPNRRLFLDRLQHALERSSRSQAVHAVLFIDLDRFKLANDSLGHQAGDQVLITIANRLREILRDGDTLARFGGDEFTMLLEDIGDVEAAEAVALSMLDVVRTPIVLDSGRTVMASISIGVALARAGASSDDVLHDADVAMYQAKHRGAGQHAVYDAEAMDSRSVELIDLEVQLRAALEHNELVVYFQPLFSTESRGIVGAEALVRWQHPKRGLLAPANFVSLAEETGLILELGHQVLAQACAQARGWTDQLGAPFSVAVNLSARQFQAEDLVEEIRRALDASGLEPSQLCLEVTESLAHFDIERSISILTDLKELGVQLAIDDFGTGYSSLNYLKRFPVDVVKIDGSFVKDLDISAMDTAIVRAIVDLAETTGMTAIAEGVETADQLAQLTAMGCRVVQGYYLGLPMPAAELTDLLIGHYDGSAARALGFIDAREGLRAEAVRREVARRA